MGFLIFLHNFSLAIQYFSHACAVFCAEMQMSMYVHDLFAINGIFINSLYCFML